MLLGKLKKQQKNTHFDGLSPQVGRGGFRPSPLFTYYFFTFNVKNMSKYWREKNDKTMVKTKH